MIIMDIENDEKYAKLILLQLIIDMLNTLPEKVPESMRLQTCEYKGIDLLEKGTTGIKTYSRDGAIVVTEELKPFIDFLEQCESNGEAENIVIGIYPHSNNKQLNNSIGLCNYKDTDFASINIITSNKTMQLCINCMHPISRKVGHRIEVLNNE